MLVGTLFGDNYFVAVSLRNARIVDLIYFELLRNLRLIRCILRWGERALVRVFTYTFYT